MPGPCSASDRFSLLGGTPSLSADLQSALEAAGWPRSPIAIFEQPVAYGIRKSELVRVE